MSSLKKIDLHLESFELRLFFHDRNESLLIHFNTPARKFHFTVIALVVNEMKKMKRANFIYIRKHEKILEELDNLLSGLNASKNLDNMWDKIRKAWRYKLPDLESAVLFKIPGKELIPPYEKGGKYRYDCSEYESDIWAKLFEYDKNNRWKLKFAIDSAGIDLNDIHLILDKYQDNIAWQEFIKRLRPLDKQVDIKQKVREAGRSIKQYKIIAAGTLLLVLISAGIMLYLNYLKKEPYQREFKLNDQASLAVLPLSNLMNDPSQDYLVDGITESIITTLAKVPKLNVIARNSTFIYKGKPTKVQEVSENLGTRYILEGGVQATEDNLRITAQLIDTKNGYHLWSETFDRKMEDIFTIQDEILMNIINACEVNLTIGELNSLAGKGTKNLEAYLKYLHGFQYMVEFNYDNIIKARQFYEEAVALDPEFLEAYLGIADTYMIEMMLRGEELSRQIADKARKIMQKALKMDDTHPWVYRNLATLHTRYYEWDKAIAAGRRSVELAPSDITCISRLAAVLGKTGHFEESNYYCNKSIKLNPLFHPYPLSIMGFNYLWMEKYEEAIPLFERSLQFLQKHVHRNLGLAACYIAIGREADAKKIVEKVIKINPKITVEDITQVHFHNDPTALARFGNLLIRAGIPFKK